MIPFRIDESGTITFRRSIEEIGISNINIVPFLQQYPDTPLRALSMYNPYCELMAYDKIETRGYYTKVRGLVLLCSTQKPYSLKKIAAISGNLHLGCSDGDRHGKALFIGELYDCTPMQPTDEDKTFVLFNSALKCWHFRNVRPVVPFDYKGKQGWKLFDKEKPEDMAILQKIQVVNWY